VSGLRGLDWLELTLAIGLASGAGALVGGQRAPWAFAEAVVATTAVGLWASRWRAPQTPLRPTPSLQPANDARDLQLVFAQAEVDRLSRQLHTAEAAASGQTKLLGELIGLLQPRLRRAEAVVERLLVDDVVERDRRGAGGQAQTVLRETAHLVDGLLALSRSAREQEPLRPERLDLRRALANLLDERGTVEVDAAVPTLVYCDRGVFALLIEQLVAAAEAWGARPALLITAEPQRADMVRLRLTSVGGVPDDLAVRHAITAGDPLLLAQVLLQRGGIETPLALPLAVRAGLRLGGQARCGDERAPGDVTFEFLMTVAPDRRAANRPLTLAELGVTDRASV
jgi:hypothetical protein